MDKGMVEVRMHDAPVGRIALTRDGLCAFEYDEAFLAGGFSISPYALPLEKKVFVAERDPFQGNFGVFDDSLPDGWGMLLMDRFLRSQGRDSARLSPLERLCLVGARGRGALEYGPDRSFAETPELTDFHGIAVECARLLADKTVLEADLAKLCAWGGSSGGARPKVFARVDGAEWLVKFKASADPTNVGEVEYRHALLAQSCGIAMPNVRLFQGRYFAVQRFDRAPDGKIHTVSVAAMAQVDYRHPSLDYADLFSMCRMLTQDAGELLQLYRRMVFNVFIANKDDHPKNFAFQHRAGRWRLSPAYDLLPSPGFGGQHATTVNGQGNPGQKDLLALAPKADLTPRQARAICDEIESRVQASRPARKKFRRRVK